jgi:hypothetical protein
MSERELMAIADEANMIIQGYAFTKKENTVSILNLNKPGHAMVIDLTGKMIESSMDAIEQTIVLNIWERDSEFMEEDDA